MKARLILEDGTVFTGTSFGSSSQVTGEVVFNTGITGYQEVLSDPSYCGQIVTMTQPLIGNYGINREDFEAIRPWIHGFAVRRCETAPSNWRSEYDLDTLLKEYDIPGIANIDTRMLTRRLRNQGTLRGLITTGSASAEEMLEQLAATSLLRDQVSRVSTPRAYRVPGTGQRIVVVDYGSKAGIVRELGNRGCDVIVVPHDASVADIRRFNPDGVLLSNGPGDPKDVPEAIDTVRQLIGQLPLFGICLGHQLFALASGADTTKLKFGHRGANHPVKELASGRCLITSQNHSYSVLADSLNATELEVTHLNNNDGSIEGLKHKTAPAFSVQFHPEAAPGPTDSNPLFDRFLDMAAAFKADPSAYAPKTAAADTPVPATAAAERRTPRKEAGRAASPLEKVLAPSAF
ncbi:carbamoyl phosphate synthase small subunit [Saccharibacillus alkalitolerans]|uniref:Carbamoyl phosphate synthase small chain n=1 Tax=Saccharibacillus alkalitolerans TaxID=2705290 RepID=A0ABX0F4L2_9BACL|nr:carbamoyl phosphate synthase small subunit [Saccharibacillus alkalitolerans]NGZ75410.1 glutamine-hydrolyzing carbamoyl-phosphate synthase small subunit [Saccharibacillus alkalitolerans]